MNINSNEILVEDIIEYLSRKKVILYGAGKIGKSLIYALKKDNIYIYQIWDNKYEEFNKIESIDILKPNLDIENKNDIVVIVTIYSQNVTKQIYKDLGLNGFSNILFNRTVVNSILYRKCKSELENNIFRFDLNTCHECPVSKDIDDRCNISDYYIEKEFILSKRDTKTGIIIPSMGILVSNKCNLTCIGCNQLRDEYQPSDNIEIEAKDIIFDLLKISKAVDRIEKVVIVGGESLLHKDIDFIIQRTMDIENIGIIQLITNGTVVPKDDKIFKLLNNPRVKVEVSGYGNYISDKQNKNVEIFLSKLKDNNINFEYVKTLQWFDFGTFEKRNYIKKEWQDIYNTCCFISNDLFNGELHKCARSAFGKHLHKIADMKTDYIDIRNISEDKLSQAIEIFLNNKLPNICQYCNGTSSLTIPAGKQLK